MAGNSAKLLCSIEDFLEKHKKLSESHPNYPYPEYHGNWISQEDAQKMADELDTTFGYSVGSKRDS